MLYYNPVWHFTFGNDGNVQKRKWGIHAFVENRRIVTGMAVVYTIGFFLSDIVKSDIT